MKKLSILIILVVFLFSNCAVVFAAYPAVRIKDIAHVLQARDNQIMGFGLVVGLRRTGDTSQTGFTKLALTNLLLRMGVVPQSVDFKSRNVAAVMVTTNLPPYVKSGQKLDIIVSSMGDASSLSGGTLLLTPLMGADDQVYATAQGPVSFGGGFETVQSKTVYKLQSTVGRIPGGALVEKEVPVDLTEKGVLTIVLDQPDFTTVRKIVTVLEENDFEVAAKDAGTIAIPVYAGEDPVEIMSTIENLTIVPESVAKVVIDERTGVIVIGENVRLAPVAVSYQGFTVSVDDLNIFQRGYGQAEEESSEIITSGTVKVRENKGKLILLPQAATISDLVAALNAVGATPRDMIAILQAIRKAGALPAEVEII